MKIKSKDLSSPGDLHTKKEGEGGGGRAVNMYT